MYLHQYWHDCIAIYILGTQLVSNCTFNFDILFLAMVCYTHCFRCAYIQCPSLYRRNSTTLKLMVYCTSLTFTNHALMRTLNLSYIANHVEIERPSVNQIQQPFMVCGLTVGCTRRATHHYTATDDTRVVGVLLKASLTSASVQHIDIPYMCTMYRPAPIRSSHCITPRARPAHRMFTCHVVVVERHVRCQ